MRTLNPAAEALRVRVIAGEKIPRIPLLYFGLAVPQYWALCSVQLVWGGHTWVPLAIAASEVNDDAAEFSGLRFSLPGVTSSQRALATATDVEGAEVVFYRAWVDPLTAEVADAETLWSGELDQPGWQGGPESWVNFTAEHRATLAMRQRPSLYTHDEQLRLHPGDMSLNVDPKTDGTRLQWPNANFYKVPG